LRDFSFGRRPKDFPSGSGHHVHDLLAKGLAECGHEVLYMLPSEPVAPLPDGCRWVPAPDASADIHHTHGVHSAEVIAYMKDLGRPSLSTCHLDRHTRPEQWSIRRRWIYVSRSLAATHGSSRYVLNGLDPANYTYSAAKADYFLFMSVAERARQKGLETAFRLARRAGLRLIVAGTGCSYSAIREIESACRENGAEYVGDVQGSEKADLLAGARAMLFPTLMNEAFGLVMVEALLSGTPVICSDKGACPEVIDASVGCVCTDWGDYLAALGRLPEIRPEDCRAFAVSRFHYRRMTSDYLREYEAEIAADPNQVVEEACTIAS
ncbi:MAG TPA: glycosyltransferase, partial [Verrucomicrobiae bacterium]|nr:glycosyltransferase [Verrucomicrobiae bacterium]